MGTGFSGSAWSARFTLSMYRRTLSARVSHCSKVGEKITRCLRSSMQVSRVAGIIQAPSPARLAPGMRLAHTPASQALVILIRSPSTSAKAGCVCCAALIA